MSEHSHSKVPYFVVFGLLLVCTVITYKVAEIDLGMWSTPVALAIAIFKATIIIWYFMHVRFSTWMTRVIVVASVFFLCVLFLFSLTDYVTRPSDPANPSNMVVKPL